MKEEIMLNGKKIKIITKLPKEMIEDNNTEIDLTDTIDLEKVEEELKENDKE
jgi:hypothetical protein